MARAIATCPVTIVGICVVPADFDPSSGSYTERVRDVTITGFRVVGFEGDGVFGFGTENLKVSRGGGDRQ